MIFDQSAKGNVFTLKLTNPRVRVMHSPEEEYRPGPPKPGFPRTTTLIVFPSWAEFFCLLFVFFEKEEGNKGRKKKIGSSISLRVLHSSVSRELSPPCLRILLPTKVSVRLSIAHSTLLLLRAQRQDLASSSIQAGKIDLLATDGNSGIMCNLPISVRQARRPVI